MGERHQRIILYENYQGLLTDKQREVFQAYYYEDLSLAEIAEHTKTSRQAVHDVLRRTDDLLQFYEETLGLQALEEAHGEVMETLEESLKSDQWPQDRYRELLKAWEERKGAHGL